MLFGYKKKNPARENRCALFKTKFDIIFPLMSENVLCEVSGGSDSTIITTDTVRYASFETNEGAIKGTRKCRMEPTAPYRRMNIP